MASDPVLALASALIAYASSYTALDLWSSHHVVQLRNWLWLPAAIILSVGILCSHIGMIMALTPIYGDLKALPLAASGAAALGWAAAALFATSRPGPRAAILGGVGVTLATLLLHFAHHLEFAIFVPIGFWRIAQWAVLTCLLSVSGLYSARAALRTGIVHPHLRVPIAALAVAAVAIGSVFVQVAAIPITTAVAHHGMPSPKELQGYLRAVAFGVVAVMVAAALAERLKGRLVASSMLALSQYALDLVIVVRRDGRILKASQSIEKILGYMPRDVQGRSLADLSAPGAADVALLGARGEGASLPFHYEGQLLHRDGSWRVVEGVGIDLSQDRDVGGVVLKLVDATEKRAAAQAIVRLNRQRELLLEYAGEGIVGTGADGRISFANQTALRMVDLSEEEVLGREFSDVFWICHADGTLYGPAECPVARILVEGGVKREADCLLQGLSGLRVPIDYTVTAKTEEGSIVGAVVLFVDVSHRRRYEEEKQLVAERFLAMLDQVGDPVLMEDLAGRVTFVNRSGQELLGVSTGQFRDTVQSRYGSVRLLDWRGLPLSDQDHVVEWVKRTGKPVGKVERIIERPDGTRRFLLLDAGPVFDKNGSIGGAIFTLHDVTERRAVEEELLRTRRIESVGVLAGGIAHDFNNILAVMLGNLSLARAETPPDADSAELLLQAETACRQATRLTRQLLTFSKGGAPITQPLALPGLVEESVRFLLSGSTVKARFDMSDHLWSVEADEGQISQVLQNLLVNAKQAMPEGGTVRVETRNCRVTQRDSLPLAPGDYVRISICDEGAGIAPDVIDRIFDPYFSTKPSGQGLGLATTWSIVRRHRGHISVETLSAGGTAFHVYLPRSHRAAPAATSPGVLPRSVGKILVMDDDAAVRQIAERMLRNLGHLADGVGEGAAAVARCKEALQRGEHYDLAILDLTVSGGMGGEEASSRLREIDPGIKLIASSGYSNDAILADHAAHGFDGVLAKPYRVGDLEQLIDGLLLGDGLQHLAVDRSQA
ncbi:MAG: PAS domain S-box protein [Thermaerobacter sp.]|nr:PAS domain S-box protein [Thermaerobacter sp.]